MIVADLRCTLGLDPSLLIGCCTARRPNQISCKLVNLQPVSHCWFSSIKRPTIHVFSRVLSCLWTQWRWPRGICHCKRFFCWQHVNSGSALSMRTCCHAVLCNKCHWCDGEVARGLYTVFVNMGDYRKLASDAISRSLSCSQDDFSNSSLGL